MRITKIFAQGWWPIKGAILALRRLKGLSVNEMKERGIRIIGLSDDAPHTLFEADLSGPVALVLGAEGPGMRQLTRKTCDELVSIPMAGAVESLNVSVAAAVCLYEAHRQRSAAASS